MPCTGVLAIAKSFRIVFVACGLIVMLLAARSIRAQASPDATRPAVAADSVDELTPVPVPEPSPLAVEYHRTGIRLWLFGRLWVVLVPLVILFTGTSARMRDVANKIGRNWFGTIAMYVVLFLLLDFIADLPLRYYAGFVRQHTYGLSNQSFAKWFGDALKGLVVEAVGGVCFAWVPFWLIGRFPKRWWLIMSGLSIPFTAFVALVAPVWIDPLFNNYGPMKDPKLEHELLDLAARAGISGSRVFEVNKSVDTNALNAYVTGMFGTKRIVLWDTLLAKLDDREVLAVMGHEMGHYVLNHIPKSVVLGAFGVLASLFWVDRAGRRLSARFSRRFGFDSLADVAATPLLLVLMAVSSLVLGPIGLALSRHHEHEADRFALDLTHANRSAAHAFVTLQRENLSVPRHDWLETIFRGTHPSIAERIEFCNEYHPWATGR
jgi:STE24 endopeptidase